MAWTLRDLSSAAVIIQTRTRRHLARRRSQQRARLLATVAQRFAAARVRHCRKERARAMRSLGVAAAHRLAASRAVKVAGDASRSLDTLKRTDAVMATCAALQACLAHDAAEAEWLRQYVSDRTALIPDTLRDLLGSREPNNPNERLANRAKRGHLGICCEGCGSVGHYRSTCDTCNVTPRALYWYQPPTIVEDTGKPYRARSHGEANLHLVLHLAIDTLRDVLARGKENFAETILVEPRRMAVAPRNNRAVFDEDRDFLLAKTDEEERKALDGKHAHDFRGSIRPAEGDVDDTDDLWKRGVAYCFDRSHAKGQKRAAELIRNYRPDPRAARRNAHAHRPWLEPLSKHDRHASSGKKQSDRGRDVEQRLRHQAAWSTHQATHMENRHRVWLHALSLVHRELQAEILRESKQTNGLPHDERQARVELAKLEQERTEAADRMMRILVANELVTSIEEAEYLIYANKVASRVVGENISGAETKNHSVAALLGVATVDKTHHSAIPDTVTSPVNRAQESVSLFKNDLALYMPKKRSGDYAHHAKSSQLKRLAASGPGRLRHGTYEDDATVMPAVLSLPRSLASGGPAPPPPLAKALRDYQRLLLHYRSVAPAVGYEKSATAGILLDDARARFAHSDRTRRKRRQLALPFWVRMTEAASGPGQRCYSEIFGQPMEKLFAPGTLPPLHILRRRCTAKQPSFGATSSLTKTKVSGSPGSRPRKLRKTAAAS